MWKKPEEGTETEIDEIREEVEYRRRIAEGKGLDRLFLDAYHRSIRYYPVWIRNEREKTYVYPEVASATETITRESAGDTFVTEFSIKAKRYKITSQRRGNVLTHDVYYVMELFLNDKKVFAVRERHDVRLKDAHYYTFRIDAYASENWVEDFRNIKAYQERVEKAEAEPVEDPQLIAQLKKDFNIGDKRIVRLKIWPKAWLRLFVWLIILVLTILTLIEFETLLRNSPLK